MFKLFLRKKLFSGSKKTLTRLKGSSNRRLSARYAIDHKHLTLMNEQDILLVREISAKGFSVELSPRGFERLTIGDVYEARIRYLGEIHDLNARVAWKHDGFVGFEIVQAQPNTLQFIKRLLKPVEIAASLKPVEASFLRQTETGKSWFHGDADTDLFAWHHPETGELTAWQLSIGDAYVEWRRGDGLSSGSYNATASRDLVPHQRLIGPAPVRDIQLDPGKRQFAVDIIMALAFQIRDELLETLTLNEQNRHRI